MLAAIGGIGGNAALAAQNDEDIHQTVARISYMSGGVSFSRGDDPDDWQAADLNVPVTLGDRVYTGDDGRLELQVHGGNSARLDSQTDLATLNLSDDTKQFSLNEGTASFDVRRLADEEIFEVDTPNAAVTFERSGQYRLDVDADGNTRVGVHRGRATVAAAGGEVSLNPGDEMDIDGIDSPEYDVVGLPGPDRFDRWVELRESRLERVRSYDYVNADIAGVEDLDEYGRWSTVPGYGMVWSPTVAEAGWQPYREGHWVWQDPWGWTWIAAEPWGWAPYHYGRWVFYASRWYWVPVSPSVPYVAYSPALVAFVGGGPGWSASLTVSPGGWVGWFPLAPADPFVPWWGARSRVSVTNVTKVTYVNRTYVTVVNQNTFVSGGFVKTNIVRSPAVVRQVSVAAVSRGPVPLVPTRASLRVAVRSAPASPPRPPAPLAARPVVVRMAPPPAPITFQRKIKVIEENRGQPVSSAVATRLSTEEREPPRALVAVRPVAEEPGVVKLRSRRQDAAAPRQPEPVRPPKGRAMATREGPVQAAQPAPGAPAEQPSEVPPAVARPRGRGRGSENPAAPQRPSPAAEEREQERGREGRPAAPRREQAGPPPSPAPSEPPPSAGRREGEPNRPRPPEAQQERPTDKRQEEARKPEGQQEQEKGKVKGKGKGKKKDKDKDKDKSKDEG